jgi:hypothetical protein|tara:strand:+ start:440 stop:631 length:192 start_codon:yes stop_codon:yes gene_type:complete
MVDFKSRWLDWEPETPNCYFCDALRPMFPIDGANSSICGECLVETVHKALILDAEQSEEEEQS